MEGSAGRVQGGGEPAAPPQSAKGADQGHEGADDEIAEHHVPEQLPVGPAGAVRAAAEIFGGGVSDHGVERATCPFHLLVMSIGCNATLLIRR